MWVLHHKKKAVIKHLKIRIHGREATENTRTVGKCSTYSWSKQSLFFTSHEKRSIAVGSSLLLQVVIWADRQNTKLS